MDDGRMVVETRPEGDFGDLVKVRKFVMHVEEVLHEFGPPAETPQLKGYIAAVAQNPYAGRYVEDIMPLMEQLKPMGIAMAKRLMAVMGGPNAIVGYGKAAIVGENGEKEHAAACMHPTMGKPLRAAVGPAPSIIPSAKKIGGPGATIDCPLHHKEDVWTFSHFDAMEVSLSDAPRADEIMVIIAITDSGRPLHRVGEGKTSADVGGD